MRRTRKRYAVLYDGLCGFCRRSMRLFRRFDLRGRLEWIDIRRWEEVQGRFPSLDAARCREELHVVRPDGRILAGFDAYRRLLWLLPVFQLMAPFLYIPGVPWAGRRIYRTVARHRRTDCALDLDPGTSVQ